MASSWAIKGGGRRLLERIRYEAIATQYAQLDGMVFMNFGYRDTGEPLLPLEPQDEPHRCNVQLYERVTRPVPLAGKDVLEVGCGRGGGASFLARRHAPRSYVGADFIPATVELCRKWHAVPGLSFQVGDAEHLPFPADAFDVVVNVESSHGYGSMAAFLSEVFRVLRPGGALAWADLRITTDLDNLDALFARTGFQVVEHQDLTPGVLESLASSAPQRLALMLQEVPPDQMLRFLEAGAFPGSATFQALCNGSYRYVRGLLRKPG